MKLSHLLRAGTSSILVMLTVLLLSMSAGAQGLRVTQPPPDCNVFKSAFDNPFSDTRGWTQPRIAWHAEYAVGSYFIASVVRKVTHLPPWLAATVTSVGIGVLPHVRSVVIQRRYPINPGDIAFDAVNRATPYVWLASHSDDTTRSWASTHWKPVATWLVADLSLACFSSP
jgi:hypothetical protein